MNKYHRDAAPLRYSSPSTVFAVLGGLVSTLGVVLAAVAVALCRVGAALAYPVGVAASVCLGLGTFGVGLAVALALALPHDMRICHMVRRGLFDPAYGNPMGLKEGQILPSVQCRAVKIRGSYPQYILRVYVVGCEIDNVAALASYITSTLTGRYSNYAITQTYTALSGTHVDFLVEDVTIDKTIIARSVDDLKPDQPTTLMIQHGVNIDLTTSGSILVAGKTRSGKTTGIISILLQVLQWGADKFGSRVTIIDPKRAELSRLPGVVTVDEDGGGHAILEAMKKFAMCITERQAALNDLSEKLGDAVKWWDAEMHPCFLFVDEYVACRSLFPARADKNDPEYCLTEFDNILKRIITMGASAGCFAIISIAEASVQEGGLPAMLRSAMSTKILFRPTMSEARLLWPSEKLEAMMDKGHYAPGEAWFSSTDGEHDDVTFARFPRMEFPVYAALANLLRLYGE